MGDFKKEFGKNFLDTLKGLISTLQKDLGYAVEFPEGLTWINTTEPLTLEKLRGHVILLDFWTYCCINCIHVLEDLKYLEDKYTNEPFVVIGVHSAKFKNEKDVANVRSAVGRYEIKHPVVVDNDHFFWKAYSINAWPSFVLIDPEGKILGKTAGEGQKGILDNSITDALERGREEGTLADEKLDFEPDIFIESFLKYPGKIALDPENEQIFISDSNHNRILRAQLEKDAIANIIDIIGNEEPGLADGYFKTAQFHKPQGIFYQDNHLYVADTENHALRKIDLENKTVKTIAGTGNQGRTRIYSGNPLKVSLNSPWDLIGDETFLYIAMAGTHQLWRYNLRENIIENFAGNGREDIRDGNLQEALLAQPSGLALDNIQNRLYFMDSEVSALRYADLTKNTVNTLIGKGLFIFGRKDGSFEDALLQHPLGIDIHKGKIYIADTYNHALREVDLLTKKIQTLIYQPKKGICKIGDEKCDFLPLNEPNDVLFYEGKLWIADTNNHLIRIFDLERKDVTDLYLFSEE